MLVNTFEVISEGSSQGWNAESARQAVRCNHKI